MGICLATGSKTCRGGHSNLIKDPFNLESSVRYYQQQANSCQLTEEESIEWLTLASSRPSSQNDLEQILTQVTQLHGTKPCLKVAYVAFEAIQAWRLGQLQNAEQCIHQHAGFLSQPIHPLSARMRIFFNMVVQLVKLRQQNSQLYHPDATARPLVVLGESHSLPLAHLPLRFGSQTYQPENRFVIGLKMHHLANPKASYHALIVQEHFAQLSQKNDWCALLFCIGEIDCRPNEGIWHVINTRVKQADEVIEL